MADLFTKKKRSAIMARIRAKNSKAELITFSFLRKEGVYFQRHYKKAAGSPDIALPRKKKAVFIDGDFWHGRDFERIVRSRGEDDYWPKKIAGNMKRDARQRKELRKEGWEILRIWESDIKRVKTRGKALDKIKKFLVD